MRPTPLHVFCKVIELSSFRRAAEQLGIPVATASHQVMALEKRLGVKLLTRSTRKVEPTAEGQAHWQRIAPLLQGIDEAEEQLGRVASNGAAGHLHVSAPASVVRTLIAAHSADFQARYPDIFLRILATDNIVSLADHGLDCVIRAGPPRNDGLVARAIGKMPQFFAASPCLIQRMGPPDTLEDLRKYPFINYDVRHNPNIVVIDAFSGTRQETFEAHAKVCVNDGDAYVAFARQGLGVIQSPLYDLKPHLTDGTLQLLLPEWQGPELAFHAIYARGRQLLPKVKAFVDWVETRLFDARCPPATGVIAPERASHSGHHASPR